MQTEDIGGWAFAVTTQRLGGGKPLEVIYAVALPWEEDARVQLTIREGLLNGDDVTNCYPLSEATISALGMDEGDVLPL